MFVKILPNVIQLPEIGRSNPKSAKNNSLIDMSIPAKKSDNTLQAAPSFHHEILAPWPFHASTLAVRFAYSKIS